MHSLFQHSIVKFVYGICSRPGDLHAIILPNSRTFPAFFHYFRLFNTVYSKQMFDKSLPMTGFKPRISVVGGGRSTNWATTTAQFFCLTFTHLLCWTSCGGSIRVLRRKLRPGQWDQRRGRRATWSPTCPTPLRTRSRWRHWTMLLMMLWLLLASSSWLLFSGNLLKKIVCRMNWIVQRQEGNTTLVIDSVTRCWNKKL